MIRCIAPEPCVWASSASTCRRQYGLTVNLFLDQHWTCQRNHVSHISASSCRAKQKKEESDKKAAEADTKKKKHANKTMKMCKKRREKTCRAENLEEKTILWILCIIPNNYREDPVFWPISEAEEMQRAEGAARQAFRKLLGLWEAERRSAPRRSGRLGRKPLFNSLRLFPHMQTVLK